MLKKLRLLKALRNLKIPHGDKLNLINILLGRYKKKIIHFYVPHPYYSDEPTRKLYAEEGMTFEEFSKSKYNVDIGTVNDTPTKIYAIMSGYDPDTTDVRFTRSTSRKLVLIDTNTEHWHRVKYSTKIVNYAKYTLD